MVDAGYCGENRMHDVWEKMAKQFVQNNKFLKTILYSIYRNQIDSICSRVWRWRKKGIAYALKYLGTFFWGVSGDLRSMKRMGDTGARLYPSLGFNRIGALDSSSSSRGGRCRRCFSRLRSGSIACLARGTCNPVDIILEGYNQHCDVVHRTTFVGFHGQRLGTKVGLLKMILHETARLLVTKCIPEPIGGKYQKSWPRANKERQRGRVRWRRCRGVINMGRLY